MKLALVTSQDDLSLKYPLDIYKVYTYILKYI